MRKFRILVKESAGGLKEYFPQYKDFLFWRYFDYDFFPRESFYNEYEAERFIKTARDSAIIKTYIKD